MSLASSRNRAADRMALEYDTRVALRGDFGMHDFYGPTPPKPVKAGPIVMVVLAAMMLGASSGILIADRDVLRFLEKNIVSQLASVRGYLDSGASNASAKPEAPTVIPTGLSSIAAIYYSSNPASAQVAFDLGTTDVVGTGKLTKPDRIYFDLKDRSRGQATVTPWKSEKAVSISGSLLHGVRISRRKPGVTRVVLDLKRLCDFTYKTSAGPPSRLTVEIRPCPAGASASE